MKKTKKLVFLSLLVAAALALSIVESMLPIPILVPGAKLGLTNIIGLITIVLFGFKEAMIVAILRSITFAVATGSISSLFYSLSGAILSTIVMYLVYKFLSNYFSLIGVSITGAISHNVAQLGVASIIMESIKIFYYLPVMVLISLFTGYFVGLASIYISNNLKKNFKKILIEKH